MENKSLRGMYTFMNIKKCVNQLNGYNVVRNKKKNCDPTHFTMVICHETKNSPQIAHTILLSHFISLRIFFSFSLRLNLSLFFFLRDFLFFFTPTGSCCQENSSLRFNLQQNNLEWIMIWHNLRTIAEFELNSHSFLLRPGF